MEATDGYKILKRMFFETGHGFILAQAKDRDKGFMVWQFTETPFGRDFYHGRSFVLMDEAERDYRRRADNYRCLCKAGKRPRQNPARYYRYYSTQRPVDIGAYPKPDGNAPVVVVNYDEDRRRPVAGGNLHAWGELTYRKPLAKELAEAYELAAPPDRPNRKTG
mgnify:FL=1